MLNSSFGNHKLKDESDQEIKDDFIVHNMPEANRFSGQTFANTSSKQAPIIVPAGKLDDHHKIGILIISGGIILIGALIYAAYVFMIKPAVKTPVAPIVKTEVPVEEAPVAAEPIVPVVEPVVEPIVATTTSEVVATSSDLLPEEKNTNFIPSVVSVVDSDFDGLTDDEEKLIGTNLSLADTDTDSYSDIAELKSGYNPLLAGKKMDESSMFSRYQVDSRTSVLYLNNWEVTRSDANNTIVFTDEDKAFIQVTFQNNDDKLPPFAWYEKQFAGLMPGESISGDSWSGFYSQDNSAAYIFSNDLLKIYTIAYSPLIENDLNFPFFRLMAKTITIK